VALPKRVLTVTEARKRLPWLLDRVAEGRGPYHVGPRGKASAVLVQPEEYERLQRIAAAAGPQAGWDGLRLELVGSADDLEKDWAAMRAERQESHSEDLPPASKRARPRRSR
jgi:prevent-host-death family protein